MRVGPDDPRDPAIEVPANRYFFTGRLRMEVDKDDGCFCAQPFHFRVEGGEGIFERRLNERAALGIDDGDFALRGFEDDTSLPWGSGWVIERAQHAGFPGHVIDDFSLIPNVVATRHDSRSGAHQADRQFRSDPPSGRGIFAIHDREIDVA